MLSFYYYVDISDPPPDYFSVVRNLQEARRESTSTCGFVVKALKIIFTLSKYCRDISSTPDWSTNNSL